MFNNQIINFIGIEIDNIDDMIRIIALENKNGRSVPAKTADWGKYYRKFLYLRNQIQNYIPEESLSNLDYFVKQLHKFYVKDQRINSFRDKNLAMFFVGLKKILEEIRTYLRKQEHFNSVKGNLSIIRTEVNKSVIFLSQKYEVIQKINDNDLDTILEILSEIRNDGRIKIFIEKILNLDKSLKKLDISYLREHLLRFIETYLHLYNRINKMLEKNLITLSQNQVKFYKLNKKVLNKVYHFMTSDNKSNEEIKQILKEIKKVIIANIEDKVPKIIQVFIDEKEIDTPQEFAINSHAKIKIKCKKKYAYYIDYDDTLNITPIGNRRPSLQVAQVIAGNSSKEIKFNLSFKENKTKGNIRVRVGNPVTGIENLSKSQKLEAFAYKCTFISKAHLIKRT
ncbi:MAG: hypothetical protein ACQER9_01210 [Nanobdellota archaeon]